jgi:hypothetical protein
MTQSDRLDYVEPIPPPAGPELTELRHRDHTRARST